MGLDLGRRMGAEQLFGMTTQLITTASGSKMGKTADGAVWLSPDSCSPYSFWQFWRDTDDRDVVRFLKLYTTLPLPEIAKLAGLRGAEINEAKKILATEVTTLLHGKVAAEQAAEGAKKTFEEGALSSQLPLIDVATAEFEKGISVLDAFVKAGLSSSKSDARRQIQGGGLKVNDRMVESDQAQITIDDLSENLVKLSVGKKRNVVLRMV